MTNLEERLTKTLGKELKRHHSLPPYNTLGVGGRADYFFSARQIDDLIRTVSLAWELGLPVFVLGKGSNVLFSDRGFPGIVIHNLTDNIVFLDSQNQILADSGITLARLAIEAAGRDLAGLEYLAGIPGTLGGALVGNAGSFGWEISQLVKSLTLLINHGQKPEIINEPVEWLEAGYRRSKIKELPFSQRPIILSVRLQLSPNKKEDILRRLNDCQQQRYQKQPIGERTAGSVFRNHGQRKERTAGWLLEQAGAKKLRIGKAIVAKKHANFIIAKPGATAADIHCLIEKMRQLVQEKFQLVLEEEIEYVGDLSPNTKNSSQ